MLLAWKLPASALLPLVSHPLWPYLALFGAGVTLSFSLLISFWRVFLKRAGRRLGTRASEKAAYAFGGLWAISAVAMMGLAAARLSP